VRVREYSGRQFYDLVAQPGIRGLTEILKEALPKVHEWVTRQPSNVMVQFTVFLGRGRQDRNGRTIWPQVKLLVGKGGIVVQIPHPVIIGRVWSILAVAEEINRHISPYNFTDDVEGSQVDDFNPPDVEICA
jgi:hypothetical protein